MPVWRRQLRSRVFRTTLLVVLVHVICWLPYNFLAILDHVDPQHFMEYSEHLNIFKSLQVGR
jgi:hypothetical protein